MDIVNYSPTMVNYMNYVSEQAQNNGVLLKDLSDDKKLKIQEQIQSFMESIEASIDKEGSLESIADNISQIGSDKLREKENQTLTNDILKRVSNYSNSDSLFSKSVENFNKQIAHQKFTNGIERGNVVTRTLLRLPGAKMISKKLIATHESNKTSQEQLESFEKLFRDEINLLDQDRQSLIQEKNNIFDTLDSLQEISYMLEVLIDKHKNVIKALKESDEKENQIRAELLKRNVHDKAVERLHTIQQVTLVNLAAYQSTSNIIGMVDEIKQSAQKTIDVALPSIKTNMVANIAADTQAKALDLIEGANQLANDAINNLVVTIGKNQERLKKLESNSVINVNAIIKNTEQLQRLTLEYNQFKDKKSEMIAIEVQKLAPRIQSETDKINKTQNIGAEIKLALDFFDSQKKVESNKNSNESTTSSESSKSNNDSTSNDTSTSGTDE